MGLRIHTDMAALRPSRTLRRSTLVFTTRLERLSIGSEVDQAKERAAGPEIAQAVIVPQTASPALGAQTHGQPEFQPAGGWE